MSSENTTIIREMYDGIAPGYERVFERIGFYRGRVRRFLRRVEGAGAPTRLLEIGCGPGHLSAGLGASVSVVGLDLAPRMIELARRRRPAGRFEVHDFHQPLPAGLGRFDWVMAVGCFDFCGPLAQVLGHLRNAMADGARLLFTVEEERPRRAHLPRRSWHVDTRHGRAELFVHSRPEVEEALAAAGLQPVAYAYARGWRYLPLRRTIHYGWWEAQPIAA